MSEKRALNVKNPKKPQTLSLIATNVDFNHEKV
jgi:hypothetical protein